jgi:hypothetical protein
MDQKGHSLADEKYIPQAFYWHMKRKTKVEKENINKNREITS